MPLGVSWLWSSSLLFPTSLGWSLHSLVLLCTSYPSLSSILSPSSVLSWSLAFILCWTSLLSLDTEVSIPLLNSDSFRTLKTRPGLNYQHNLKDQHSAWHIGSVWQMFREEFNGGIGFTTNHSWLEKERKRKNENNKHWGNYKSSRNLRMFYWSVPGLHEM